MYDISDTPNLTFLVRCQIITSTHCHDLGVLPGRTSTPCGYSSTETVERPLFHLHSPFIFTSGDGILVRYFTVLKFEVVVTRGGQGSHPWYSSRSSSNVVENHNHVSSASSQNLLEYVSRIRGGYHVMNYLPLHPTDTRYSERLITNVSSQDDIPPRRHQTACRL